MTYMFKVARRLASFPSWRPLTLVMLAAACGGEDVPDMAGPDLPFADGATPHAALPHNQEQTPTLQAVILAPASATVLPGATQQFSASGRMSDGTTAPVAVTFSATGGTINSSGLFTAGLVSGGARVVATSAAGTADTALVTVGASVASVSVKLSVASLAVGQTAQATATAYDAGSQPLSGRSFTWSTSNGAVASVSASGVVSAVAAGTVTISAQSGGQSGSASLSVTSASLAGTPIACVGTPLAPTDDWAVKVSGAPAGTTFCVQDGVHRRARRVVPKTGMRFLGVSHLGATLDGGDSVTYAFQASSTGPGVTLKHLRIVKYAPPDGAKAMIQGDNGRGWVVDSNEIAYSGAQGVRVGDRGHIGWNDIHNNAVMGIGLYKADSVMIEGNRLAFNPASGVSEAGSTARASQMKIFATVGTMVRNNVVEDGPKKGIWFDTDNYLVTIEGNTVRRQGGPCIWYEVGYTATIRGNTVDSCGLSGTSTGWVSNAGIQVTNSYPVEIVGNTVLNSANGITGMAVAATSGNYFTGNRGPKALGIHVQDNVIRQPTGKAAGVRSTGTGADTAFTWAGRSTWQRNSYDLTGNPAPFTWSNTNKTRLQWQALNFDNPGTFTP